MTTTTTDLLRRYRRLRTGVRLTLVLGVAASVVANILHANPNPVSQAIAGWAPLALLLCVEIITRIPVHNRGRAWLRIAATTIIAGIAAWVSYWHMVGVAQRYGETGITPYLLPISVDGLIVVASISLVEIGAHIRHHETTGHPDHDNGQDSSPNPGQDSGQDHEPNHQSDADLASLLPRARLIINAHQQATGRTITPADLAHRMGTTTDTAAALLAAIHSASTGTLAATSAAPATHNGHRNTTGPAVQEALW